jgi:uncharacterized membrane protein
MVFIKSILACAALSVISEVQCPDAPVEAQVRSLDAVVNECMSRQARTHKYYYPFWSIYAPRLIRLLDESDLSPWFGIYLSGLSDEDVRRDASRLRNCIAAKGGMWRLEKNSLFFQLVLGII